MYVIAHPAEYCAGKASEEAPRAVHDSVEYGLCVSRRAADDTKHLGRGRLLLERLREISIARLQLLEQPDVLDGDDGLGREGLEERDLLIRERLDRVPVEGQGSQERVVLEHGDGQRRPH